MWRIGRHMCDQRATGDQAVAALAGRQHGIVSVEQLRWLGLSKHWVHLRVRQGRLHPIHRGVYAIGHGSLSLEGRWMAAVLACGPGAVLSHMSAAALWGLLRPEEGPIDVSLPSKNGRRRRDGIRIHRCASLAPAPETVVGTEGLIGGAPPQLDARRTLVTVCRGIPVTTPARTVRDLRATAEPRLVRRATRQAQLAGFALDPGTRRDRTRSDLEADFLTLCRRHRLPKPEVNVRVGRWTVDFLWRRQRLAVETDSTRWHRGEVSLEDDHARDLDLRAAGFAVRRFSERQVEEEGDRVAADLVATLTPGR